MRGVISLLVIPAVCLIVSPAAAIMGIGIHGGVDNITIDSFDESFTLDDNTSVSLLREEISSPVMFGANFGIDALPFIDLELSVDACIQKYNITYVTPGRTQAEEATFGRVGINATLLRNVQVWGALVILLQAIGIFGIIIALELAARKKVNTQ